jgi:FimV-like protein
MSIFVHLRMKALSLVLVGMMATSAFSDPSYVQALPSDDFSQTDSQSNTVNADNQTGTDAFGQPDVQPSSSTPAPDAKLASTTKNSVDLSPMDASAQSTLLLSRMMQVNQDFLAFESKTTDQINQLQAASSQLSTQMTQIQTASQQSDSLISLLQTTTTQSDTQTAAQITALQKSNAQLNTQVSTLATQLAQEQAKMTQLTEQVMNIAPHRVTSLKDFKNEIGLWAFYSIVGIFSLLIVIILILLIGKKKKKIDISATDHKSDYDYLSTKEALPAKLDLARSYIVMEDFVSAKLVLSEILQAGDTEQKALAETLLKECEPKDTHG